MNISLHTIKKYIWCDPEHSHPVKKYTTWLLRILYVLGRDLMQGQLTLRASSLSYTTLLSLVPLLAVSFSVLQAFGVYNQLEPLLLQFLEPLGPKGAEIGEQIVSFVSNMRVGVLGSIGLAMLFYTVISLVNKIEKSFNYTWRVEENRSFGRRFSDYLSVILIGPVLMFSAVGLSASLMSTTLVQQLLTIEPFGSALYFVGKTVPKLLIILAFTFIYVFIPNTRVKLGAALAGAVFASILWQIAGWGFTSFVASSTKYAAIYSSFAILITFLIWLYLNWLIVLVGAQTAYYIQNPAAIQKEKVVNEMSEEFKERLALSIMSLIAENFYYNKPQWSMERLSEVLNVPQSRVQSLLELMEKHRLIVASNENPPTWLPGRDIEKIRVDEIICITREAGDPGVEINMRNPVLRKVHNTVQDMNELIVEKLSGKNIKDLALAGRYKENTDIAGKAG